MSNGQEVGDGGQFLQKPRLLLGVELHPLLVDGDGFQDEFESVDSLGSTGTLLAAETSEKVLDDLAGVLLVFVRVGEQFLQVGEKLLLAGLFVGGREEELAETLHGQLTEGSFAVLHQVCQPGHALRGTVLLSLDYVDEEVGFARATEKVA